MLFFIDETWQAIAGQPVGALGAVGIPRAQYNGFCREVLQKLPMEFAVEAQKLVGISLEGSVG